MAEFRSITSCDPHDPWNPPEDHIFVEAMLALIHPVTFGSTLARNEDEDFVKVCDQGMEATAPLSQ